MKTKIILLVLLFIAGCAFVEADKNRANLIELKVGMTKQQALDVMGQPRSTECYGSIEVWSYLTELIYVSEFYQRELTPLLFKNNILQGWGREYVDTDLKKYEIRIR